jgi:hypothetical protein
MIFKCFRLLIIIFCLVNLIFIASGCQKEQTSNPFLNLLELFPESVAGGSYLLIDHEACLKQNGISLFDKDGKRITAQELSEKYDHLYDIQDPLIVHIGLGSWYTGYGSETFSGTISYKNVGYDFTYCNSEIQNIVSFTHPLIVSNMIAAIGDYESKSTDATLDAQQNWPHWAKERYTTEKYDNALIHSWGDPNEQHLLDRRSSPHLDSLGRALPLTVEDGNLFVARSVDTIKSMIDTSTGNTRSLADISEYALVAEALSSLNVNMAIIADESKVNGNPDDPNYYGEKEPGPLLNKFLACGTGYGKDEKGSYIALVLVHGNNDQAKENVPQLEKRVSISKFPTYSSQSSIFDYIDWKSGNEIITSTDIWVQDNILYAKLYTEELGMWYQWFLYQGNLLVHKS